MIRIGINGFGRIGKSILNQTVLNKKIRVDTINFPGFNIDKIASYINNDSFHLSLIHISEPTRPY